MPKKVAKTKQKSPRKSQKNNKLKSFLAKLNPETTKAKLVAFVVVFGMLGGGYYVYDTLAFTGKHVVTLVARNYTQQSGVRRMTINPEGKGPVEAAHVSKGARFVIDHNSGFDFMPSRKYNVCFEMYNSRQWNTVSLVGFVPRDGTEPWSGRTVSLRPVDRFQTHCVAFSPAQRGRGLIHTQVNPVSHNVIVNKVTIVEQ